MQDEDAHQVELGTAVHLALEVFELVDLAFDLTAASGRAKDGVHSLQVGLEARGEALQVGRSAKTRPRQPAVEALEITVAHQAVQAQCQLARNGDCGFEPAQGLHEPLPVVVLCRRELALLPPQHPVARTTR